MVDCNFCDKTFDSDYKLHIHWGEQHEEELNSHQEEKVKKAERKKDEQKQEKIAERKRMAGYGLAGLAALAVLGFIVSQVGITGDNFEEGELSSEIDLSEQAVLGNSDANVTVVEFGDYSCPHCKSFHEQTQQQIKNEYLESGEVKFVYMHFPFLGPESNDLSVASECVYNQDEEAFWNFHDAVFTSQNPQSVEWGTTEFIMQLARDNTEGLDYNQLESCIASQDTQSKVDSEMSLGRSNGVDSTPTVFVNGQKVRNSYSSIKAAIEQELQ